MRTTLKISASGSHLTSRLLHLGTYAPVEFRSYQTYCLFLLFSFCPVDGLLAHTLIVFWSRVYGFHGSGSIGWGGENDMICSCWLTSVFWGRFWQNKIKNTQGSLIASNQCLRIFLWANLNVTMLYSLNSCPPNIFKYIQALRLWPVVIGSGVCLVSFWRETLYHFPLLITIVWR